MMNINEVQSIEKESINKMKAQLFLENQSMLQSYNGMEQIGSERLQNTEEMIKSLAKLYDQEMLNIKKNLDKELEEYWKDTGMQFDDIDGTFLNLSGMDEWNELGKGNELDEEKKNE